MNKSINSIRTQKESTGAGTVQNLRYRVLYLKEPLPPLDNPLETGSRTQLSHTHSSFSSKPDITIFIENPGSLEYSILHRKARPSMQLQKYAICGKIYKFIKFGIEFGEHNTCRSLKPLFLAISAIKL
jgi:hypothetical protein